MVFTKVDTTKPEFLQPATTTKMVMIVEYDGTHYHGSQLQANLPTIQEAMESALWKLTGEKTRIMTASRTDAGVHAKGQVVSFRTGSSLPPRTFISGLNYYLPRDIAVKAAHRTDESFNVRRRAISREYNYYILNSATRSPLNEGSSYTVARHLDINAMNQAGQALLGRQDFASFASSIGTGIKNTTRTVYKAEMKREGELVVFSMVANSFLPHQVRNTIGALVKVGLGKSDVETFHRIARSKSPSLAGPASPPHGLFLIKVNYPDGAFG